MITNELEQTSQIRPHQSNLLSNHSILRTTSSSLPYQPSNQSIQVCEQMKKKNYEIQIVRNQTIDKKEKENQKKTGQTPRQSQQDKFNRYINASMSNYDFLSWLQEDYKLSIIDEKKVFKISERSIESVLGTNQNQRPQQQNQQNLVQKISQQIAKFYFSRVYQNYLQIKWNQFWLKQITNQQPTYIEQFTQFLMKDQKDQKQQKKYKPLKKKLQEYGLFKSICFKILQQRIGQNYFLPYNVIQTYIKDQLQNKLIEQFSNQQNLSLKVLISKVKTFCNLELINTRQDYKKIFNVIKLNIIKIRQNKSLLELQSQSKQLKQQKKQLIQRNKFQKDYQNYYNVQIFTFDITAKEKLQKKDKSEQIFYLILEKEKKIQLLDNSNNNRFLGFTKHLILPITKLTQTKVNLGQQKYNLNIQYFILPQINRQYKTYPIKSAFYLDKNIQQKQNISKRQYIFTIKLLDNNLFIKDELFGKITSYKDINDHLARFLLNQKTELNQKEIQYYHFHNQKKKRKLIHEKHYALAFQGGGAKGLAYVGVYKALRENPSIPIKTVIGSSAGGIFALAVSTGISPYQLLQICCKMNDIPKKDRFDQTSVLKDENGKLVLLSNSQKQQRIKNKEPGAEKYQTKQQLFKNISEGIKKVLHEYGILSQQFTNMILNNILTTQLEKCLLQFLQVFNPTFNDIFHLDNKKLNLYGLLLHGAIMKGQEIQNIASQCLSKYFFNLYTQYKQNSIYNKYEFQKLFKTIQRKKMQDILHCLDNYYRNQQKISQQSFEKIKQNLQQEKKQQFQTAYQNKLKNYFICVAQQRKSVQVKNQNKQKKYQNLDFLLDKFSLTGITTINQLVQNINLLIFNQQKLNKLPLYIKKSILIDLLAQTIQQNNNKYTEKQIKDNKPNTISSKLFDDKTRIYQDLKDQMKKITLRQYYSCNEVQLTCTSVDLDSKIMRFFNHKTTPNLPVCKAVQMTGSFPVGFKSQIWNKDWGYYSIHFTGYRRSIDLSGHQFTDGGMLANFPIKYLDNRDMRPKYFSHEKENSVFLGFGLDEVQEKNQRRSQIQREQQNDKKQSIKKAMQKLSKTLLSSVEGVSGAFKMAVNALKSPFKNTKQLQKVQNKQLKEAISKLLNSFPLIQFLKKFLLAYPNSDRNLNIQCFSNRIIHHDISKDLIDFKTLREQQHKNQSEINKQNKQKQNKQKFSFKNSNMQQQELIFNTIRSQQILIVNKFLNTEDQKENKIKTQLDYQKQTKQLLLKTLFNKLKQQDNKDKIKRLSLYLYYIHLNYQYQCLFKNDQNYKEKIFHTIKATTKFIQKNHDLPFLQLQVTKIIRQLLKQKVKSYYSNIRDQWKKLEQLFFIKQLKNSIPSNSRNHQDLIKFYRDNKNKIQQKIEQISYKDLIQNFIIQQELILKDIRYLFKYLSFMHQSLPQNIPQNQNQLSKKLKLVVTKFNMFIIDIGFDTNDSQIIKKFNSFNISNMIQISSIIEGWNQLYQHQKLLSPNDMVKTYFKWKLHQNLIFLYNIEPQLITVIYEKYQQQVKFNQTPSPKDLLKNFISLEQNNLNFCHKVPKYLNQFGIPNLKFNIFEFYKGQNQIKHEQNQKIVVSFINKLYQHYQKEFLIQKQIQLFPLYKINPISTQILQFIISSKKQNIPDYLYKQKIKKILIFHLNNKQQGLSYISKIIFQIYNHINFMKVIQQQNKSKYFKIIKTILLEYRKMFIQTYPSAKLNEYKQNKPYKTQYSQIIHYMVIKQLFEYYQKQQKQLKIMQKLLFQEKIQNYKLIFDEQVEKCKQKLLVINNTKDQEQYINKAKKLISKNFDSLCQSKQNLKIKNQNKYYMYHYYNKDFVFTKNFLYGITLQQANRYYFGNSISHIQKLIDTWLQKLQKAQNTKEYLKQKRSIINTAERYMSLLKNSISQLDNNKAIQQCQKHVNVIKQHQISFFYQQKLINTEFEKEKKMKKLEIQEKIRKIKVLNQEDKLKIKLLQNQRRKYFTYVQQMTLNLKSLKQCFHHIKLQQQKYNLSKIHKIQLQIGYYQTIDNVLNDAFVLQNQFSKNYQKNNLLNQELIYKEITLKQIQSSFLLTLNYFSKLQEFQKKLFKNLDKLFKILRDKRFRCLMNNINNKFTQAEAKKHLQHRLKYIISHQKVKIQQFNDSKKQIIVPLHLVLEGTKYSELYYPILYNSFIKTKEDIENQINYKLKKQGKQKNVKVEPKIITCSNYQSVFGFLISLGMNNEEIKYQMNKIEDIVYTLQRNVQEYYQSRQWIKCSKSDTKILLDQIWRDQSRMVSDLEKTFKQNHYDQQTIKNLKQQFIQRKAQMSTFCTKVLDQLLQSSNNLFDRQKFQQKKLQLAKQYGFNYQYIDINNSKNNRTIPYNIIHNYTSDLVYRIFKQVFSGFDSVIQLIILSQDLIYRYINVNDQNKSKIWKGIITKKLYSTYKLKSYICELLESKQMEPNITLKRFYQKISNKIILNFTTINLSSKKIQFINKNTAPNMPIWAAILASSSFPFFFNQFQGKQQWINSNQNSIKTISVQNFFKQKSISQKRNSIIPFVCGDTISSIPLQLVSNRILQDGLIQKSTQTQDYSNAVYLALSFDINSIPEKIKPKKIYLNYLGLFNIVQNLPQIAKIMLGQDSQIYTAIRAFGKGISAGFSAVKYIPNLFVKAGSTISGWFKDKTDEQKEQQDLQARKNQKRNKQYQQHTMIMKKLKKLPQKYQIDTKKLAASKMFSLLGTSDIKSSLQTFINSNDNLIMQLYTNKVIKCPIKIGTLDFHKITKFDKIKNTFITTQIAQQTVQRSYYITKRFLKQQMKIHFRLQFYFDYENPQQNVFKNNIKQKVIKCKLTFLSHSKWNKKPESLLKIKWQDPRKQKKELFDVENQQVQWKYEKSYINLYFYYQIQDQKNKKELQLIQSPIRINFTNITKRFIEDNQEIMNSFKTNQAQNENLQAVSTLYDYILLYEKPKQQQSTEISPFAIDRKTGKTGKDNKDVKLFVTYSQKIN